MKRWNEDSDTLPGIGLILVFLLFIVVQYAVFPELLFMKGLSYGIRWQMPFSSSGSITREALIRSSRDLDSRIFFATEGDQILLTRDLDLEGGYVYCSVWKNRIWPPDDVVWHEVVEQSLEDTVSIAIEQSGFHYLHFRIHRFTGGVRLAWEKGGKMGDPALR